MRTIKELLIILRDNARIKRTLFGPRIPNGLCNEIGHLYMENFIKDEETGMLHDYISEAVSNKNIRHPYRLYKRFLFKPTLWRCRKRWINKQIKSL